MNLEIVVDNEKNELANKNMDLQSTLAEREDAYQNLNKEYEQVNSLFNEFFVKLEVAERKMEIMADLGQKIRWLLIWNTKLKTWKNIRDKEQLLSEKGESFRKAEEKHKHQRTCSKKKKHQRTKKWSLLCIYVREKNEERIQR
jgi:DNA gyrase/topoisomerase IV subunit A